MRSEDEFESEDDFWAWMDAASRYNNRLPPARPIPDGENISAAVPTPVAPAGRLSTHRTRHVGVRLRESDFEMLRKLAAAHAVAPGTMARMLIVRGVRAAANRAD